MLAISPWAGVDHVQNVDPESMSLDRLNTFLLDMQEQPEWRVRADVEADYYDSNQYTAADLREMRDRGIPPIVVNLVAPSINMVLGLEAKTRTDFIVRAEAPSGQQDELALAMSVKMKETERLSGADRAFSDAYASQIKTGVGWIHVGFNWMNPFDYWLKVEHVHRREIWWDWHDEDPQLKKSRYLVRRKWYDEDILVGIWPQYKDLIYHCVRDWAHFDVSQYQSAVPMFMDQTCERDWGWADEEWRNGYRRRLCLYETWYRTFNRGFVLRLPDERVIEYKRGNPLHDQAVTRGVAQVEPALIPKVRLAWWLGPHRIADMPSPYPHGDFPYVPLWGYREDRTRIPYGMIRAMRPLQDEVNARRARMLWQLSARRVIADEDAVHDHDAAAEEVARPDMYLKLNRNRRNKRPDAFRIERDENLSSQQYEVYQDSKKTLQDAGGIFLEQLGKAGAADSGIAISQLIETGTTTLAEINDNAKFGRMHMGEQMLACVRARMIGKQSSVSIMQGGVNKRVRINQPRFNAETQETVLENDVSQLMCKVALDDVPQTPTARMQQFQQLTELVKTLPENLQAAVIDIVVGASDLPQKQEMIQRLREAMGLQSKDPADMTPEEQEQFQKAMDDKAKMDEIMKQLQQSEADLKAAQADKATADADLSRVKADQIRVDTGLNPELREGAPGEADTSEDTPDTPAMRMILAAERASQESVPGADQMKIERARRGIAPTA